MVVTLISDLPSEVVPSGTRNEKRMKNKIERNSNKNWEREKFAKLG